MKRIKNIVGNTCLCVLMALIPCLTSCRNSGDVFNEFVSLPESGWSKDTIAKFTSRIDDQLGSYDLWLQLRNRNDYPFQNLWLFVDITQPNGATFRDTVECILARPDGSWIGDGWGSLYTLQIPFIRNMQFREKGAYTYSFIQAMRNDNVQGMHSIGLRIEKCKTNADKN